MIILNILKIMDIQWTNIKKIEDLEIKLKEAESELEINKNDLMNIEIK